jgi:hypothetical protein
MGIESNKVDSTVPGSSLLLTDDGDLAGYLSKTGVISLIPAGAADNAITAFAGGGQASAVQLKYRKSRITTVATAADSVKLPKAIPGMEMAVTNAAAANAMNVFPASGEIINALSADTAISVAANKTMVFHCMLRGTWNTVLTA